MNVKEDIIIGFAEKIPKQSAIISSDDEDFPSLLGGNPIWFSEQSAPKNVLCKLCNNEQTFLLQLFAPLEMDHTYHRVIYIFFCQNPACANKASSITVLRDQLKKSDKIKPFQKPEVSTQKLEPIYRIETDVIEPKETAFLEKEYAKIANPFDVDDKEYKTVQISKKYAVKAENFDKENSLLKKFMQLAMEDKDFGKELDKQMAQGEEDDDDDEDLDPSFEKYCRNKETVPLWYSDKNQWNAIKKQCPYCSKNLIFEFQINSSVLNHFQSLIEYDWGIIAVYTCENSCKAGVMKEEHAEIQVVLEKEQTEESIKQHLKNVEKYCVEEEDEEDEDEEEIAAEKQKVEVQKPKEVEIEAEKPKKNRKKNKKKKNVESKDEKNDLKDEEDGGEEEENKQDNECSEDW